MILGLTYTEYVERAMLEYYEEILLHRAISDMRDGLIECQRRIIYICNKHGWTSDKQHIKFARINGNTLALHPHGEKY